jgi:oxygen-independent coproporphyrinogen-3 oxidase
VSFSLYIHIPWCQSKCPYCDFNSHAASAWPETEYTRALITELEHRAVAPPFAGDHIKTIFFGGGTPSLFEPGSIGAIIDAVERTCGIDRDAEITLEANPGTVDAAKLSGFRAAGVNRISFGAQSFNDVTLKFLGRIHSADETRAAAQLAHRAGFDRLNLDLIFAVPGQTTADVLFDIESVAALEPDHISAYNLTFEEGTAFFTDLKRGRIKQLPTDEQAAMYSIVREEIPRRGYPMYEISNYARPGHEARHNLAYWRAESYLGIGAGAHSFAREGQDTSQRLKYR